MSDEAAWKVEKAKYEEPGYVIVRKSKGAGALRDSLKTGLDGVAGEWIKLNKSDLGSGGAGGSYDDTALWKEISDLNDKVDNLDIPDTDDLATKDELAALQNQVTKDIADLKDHLDNHPSGGGDTAQIEEDITKLQESVTNLETALEAVEDGLAQEITDREQGDQKLQDQIDVINTQGYDDTELRGLISDEEDARVEGDKVLQDQIDAIQTSGYDDTQIRQDFAAADELLQDQIDALEGFDPAPLEEKDEEQDARLDQIDLDQEAQNDRLDAVEKDIEEHLANHPSGEGGGGSLTYKSITNQAHILTKGVIFLAINGAQKQYIQVNKEDLNGNKTGTPVQGELLKIEAEGKENEFTIDYITENDGYWLIIGDDDSIPNAIIINALDKEVTLTFEQDEAAGGFDPAYLEEKDAEQDDRLDAVEEEFEELKNQVDEHLTNHSDGGGNENVSQWTTKTGVRKEDSGFVEFLIASGERQSVLIPTLDADGNPSPVFEVGDIMTIKSDGHKNTFEVKSIAATAGGCVSYLSDYYGEGQFASTPDKEATIMLGEEETTDHEHEDLDDRISALEKEHGTKGPKKQFVTTTGPVNNSDGKIDLKPSLKDSSWQWVLLSAKDINGETFIHPRVGDPFTVEWGGKTITGEVTFSQGSDIWMITSDGIVTTSNTNGDPAIVYIGNPREDEPVGAHDHDEYVEKTEFEELKTQVEDHLNYEPGDVYEFTNVSYVYGNEQALCEIMLSGTQQKILVSGYDVDGNVMPKAQVGDKMTVVVEDKKNTFKIEKVETLGKASQYYGTENDDDAFNGQASELLNKPAQIIFGDEPLPIADNIVTVVDGQSGPLSIWRGTKTEYDLIARPSDEVLYIVLP